jgi:hypothetical protein
MATTAARVGIDPSRTHNIGKESADEIAKGTRGASLSFQLKDGQQ